MLATSNIHQVISKLNDISFENSIDNIDSGSSNASVNNSNSNSKETEVLEDHCDLAEYN